MDWLTRIPGLGPGFARLMKTHAWRAWDHYGQVKGDRLAAAVTYAAFLAVFPLIAVFAAVAAAALTDHQIHQVESKVAEQLPFFSDRLGLEGLVRNAGTVGVIGGVLLLYSGLGWVDTLRGSIRAIWRVDEGEDNIFAKKVKDLRILLGLAGVLAVSLLASTLTTAMIDQVADWLGLDHNGVGTVLLRVAGICVGAAADFLLIAYLLRWLPGLHPNRRQLVRAALIGAIGFELLKWLLSGYVSGVASKSTYGAFGTPVALLLWINFMTRLLLYCAAWTATGMREEQRRPEEREVVCVTPAESEPRAEAPPRPSPQPPPSRPAPQPQRDPDRERTPTRARR